MRIWESKDKESWIEETYILAMHTPYGSKYSFSMLRRFLNIVDSKNEALVIIPRDDIFNLFIKHYRLTLIDSTTKLYKAERY